MSPRKPINDQVDGPETYTEASAYRRLAFARLGSGPDVSDAGLGEFLGVSATRDRHANILLMRHPHQILSRVIALVKVDVMNIGQIIGVGYKCLSDKARKKTGSLLSLFAQYEMNIAFLVGDSLKQSALPQGLMGSSLVSDKSINAAYPAKVRDLIGSFISGHRLPSLNHLMPSYSIMMADDTAAKG